jgi:hypothetical protein
MRYIYSKGELNMVLARLFLVGGCLVSCSNASPDPITYMYVGTVDGSNAFVGLAVTGNNANLFFCGTGATLSTQTHWIPGNVTFGQTFNFTDGTATATGIASTTQASGTFTPNPSAAPLSWSANIVVNGTIAGVYDEQNAEGNAALVVIQPTSEATPVGQGAYLPTTSTSPVLQVTPYMPLVRTQQGIEVDIPIGGSTTWFLPAATGN